MFNPHTLNLKEEFDKLTLLEKLNNAIPFKAQGLLPYGIDLAKVPTPRDAFEKSRKQMSVDLETEGQQKVLKNLSDNFLLILMMHPSLLAEDW